MSRRLLGLALFIGLLALVVVLDRRSPAPSAHGISSGTALARHGFALQEVARESGIAFTHEPPRFDARLQHIMPIVAAMGASVSVADFNRDGWQDLYVTNSAEGSHNRLYRNNRNGTFTDVAGESGVADVNQPGTGVSMGSVWGDYDNDGDEDLFLYKYGRPELFRNDDGRFAPVRSTAGLPAWVNANSALWLDYDRDGALDLFIAGYWPERLNLWRLETTRMMPESFEYAENGGRKYLLRNRGNGRFEDVTAAAGLVSTRWTLAAVAADLFGSGYPDLFLANDYGIAQVFANRGGRRFEEVSRQTGIGRSPKSGMNASVGDIFNDGRLSIYQTNISEPGVLIQGNNLWVPAGGPEGAPLHLPGGPEGAPLHSPGGPEAPHLRSNQVPTFENLATSVGVDLGGWSWGAQFGDLNNDGRLDLYVANGYISGADRASYWYDFSEIAVGHSSIIADAANWPAIGARSLSGRQPKRVWLNDGRGRFADVAREVGVTDVYDGRAVALADLWNRGALDVVVANQGGPLLVYRNTVQTGRHWIAFELEGTTSNRSAIGARVELRWNGQRHVQEVSGGAGFSAQNQRRLHYGLGSASQVDEAIVRWPSGRIDTIAAPAIDRVHRLVEPR
jgi:enediyne biosynthesis protein E4